MRKVLNLFGLEKIIQQNGTNNINYRKECTKTIKQNIVNRFLSGVRKVVCKNQF